MKNEIGNLILRFVMGGIFLAHGIVKFQSGIENIAGWFVSIGLPGFMANGVALLEIIGGIALIIGLGTRVFSGLFAILLVGAIIKVKFSLGLIDGYAYDLALLAISLHLAVNGSKLASVIQLFKKDTDEVSITK
jgi:putative oxidoreductase